jgi:hypothetical protein
VLPGDFTDRLLRCVEESRPTWAVRLRRGVYVGGPLAAAAVIVLAFCGVFDRSRETKVAGVQAVNPGVVPAVGPSALAGARANLAFEDWLRQTGENIETGRRTGESLQQVLDGTLSDILELLENNADPDADLREHPGWPAPPAKSETKNDDVEDL